MLEITDHGRVREIRLCRPPANAISPELVEALIEALDRAGKEQDAVVVSGAPGLFSAGLDVPQLIRLDRPALVRFWGRFTQLLRTTAFLPVPVAFALTGHAPAGGIVMALYGDYRIMAGGPYKTGLNEVQVGLTVSRTIHQALVRLVGTHSAEKILVPGSLLSPDQALDIGLIDEIEDSPETAVERAIGWCQHLLELPRNAMLSTRTRCREDLRSLFDGADADKSAFEEIWFSDSTQRTLQSLVERLKKK